MVDENAGQLRADRLGQQGRCDRRIDAAGQRAAAPCRRRPFRGSAGRPFLSVVCPSSSRPSHPQTVVEEVADHLDAVFGVVHFRMELDAVEAPLFIGNRDVGAGGRVGGQGKAFRYLRHVIPMTHPGDALFGEALKQLAAGVKPGFGLAVFAGGIVLGLGDLAAEGVGHQLAAVADAEDRDPQLKDAGVIVGGGFAGRRCWGRR